MQSVVVVTLDWVGVVVPGGDPPPHSQPSRNALAANTTVRTARLFIFMEIDGTRATPVSEWGRIVRQVGWDESNVGERVIQKGLAALAASPEPIQVRLRVMWEEVIPLQADEFPAPMRDKWLSLMADLEAIPRGGDGESLEVADNMASTIAEKYVDFVYELVTEFYNED